MNRNLDNPFILSHVRKLYVDSNDKTHKIRELRDESTKVFTETFFGNNKTLFRFIFWVYHKINCALEPIRKELDKSEKILFFFKGGNIMFLWRKKFEERFGKSQSVISDKLLPSDCDYTIYILTPDERKYNNIYNDVKNCLIKVLGEISMKFEEKLINRGNNINNNNKGNIKYDFSSFSETKYCEWFSRNENAMFDKYFNKFYTDTKIKNYLTKTSEKIIELRDKTDNMFFDQKYEGFYRYSIPSDFNLKNTNNSYSGVKLNSRRSLYINPANKLPVPIKEGFYGPESNHYVSINSNIFNDLSGAGHLVAFDLYRIKFNTTLPKILKSGRLDTLSMNAIFQEEELNYNIPSEFIDVSIPKFDDYFLRLFRESYQKTGGRTYLIKSLILIGAPSIGIPKSILTLNIDYIIKDLVFTLFNQNNHNPLIDKKYQKRLMRVIFFFLAKQAREGKIISSDFFDNIDNTFYNNILANRIPDFQTIILMKGKKISDFFYIKREYEDLHNLLNYTILFNELTQNNDNVLRSFLEYYDKCYNIIGGINIPEFKNNFKQYKKDLSDSYRSCWNYFYGGAAMPGGKEPILLEKPINNILKMKANIKIPNKNIMKEIKNIAEEKLLDIGDGVVLDYEDITYEIEKPKNVFYPLVSFIDD